MRSYSSNNAISSLFNAAVTASINTAHFLWNYKKTWAVFLLVVPYVDASVTRQNGIKSQAICEPNFDSDVGISRWQDAPHSFFSPIEFQETTSDKLTVRDWNDFSDHQLVTGFASSNGFYFTAVDDNAEPEEEFTDRWFLVLRNGLYTAQIDQTMAMIYRLFLGHAPEIQVIKDVRNENDINVIEMQRHYAGRNNEPKYYIASRGIKNFITWNQYQANHEKYENLKIVGLGELLAIAEFFGESDLQGGNFGFMVTKDSLIAYKVDNSKALSFDCLDAVLDLNSIHLPACMDVPPNFGKWIVKSDILNEKHKMLQKIATTDFPIIEEILRRYITSNFVESRMWDIKYFESMMSENAIASMKQKVLNLKEYGLDAIIDKIKYRHQTLRAIFEKTNQQEGFNRSLR